MSYTAKRQIAIASTEHEESIEALEAYFNSPMTHDDGERLIEALKAVHEACEGDFYRNPSYQEVLNESFDEHEIGGFGA